MKTISRLFLIAGLVSLSACTPSQKSTEVQNVTSENLVIETIMSRRSIRKYKQQPVEQEKLQQILDCGINAPNGQNKQSWEIRVVNTPEYISELDSLNRSLALAKGMDASKIRHASYGAPVMIFIANDPSYDFSQVDCGLLGANMIGGLRSSRCKHDSYCTIFGIGFMLSWWNSQNNETSRSRIFA